MAACAGHGHVYRKDQCAATRIARALQHIGHEAAVFEHIQLKPHRALNGGHNLFNGAYRYAGHGEGDALAIGRAGGLHLAAARVHAGQAHGRKRHGHGELLAKQINAQLQIAHVALQNALAQGYFGQILHIAAQCVFGIRAAVDVVEQKGRQAASGCFAVIGGR